MILQFFLLSVFLGASYFKSLLSLVFAYFSSFHAIFEMSLSGAQ